MRLFRKYVIISLILFFQNSFSQEKFTLSGNIYEAESNETLIGVTIYFPELNTGTTSNSYGFYSITLPKGNYKVIVSYIGFNTVNDNISLMENTYKNYSLLESSQQLDEVIIQENVEQLNLRNPQMSLNTLTVKTIKQIPVVFGEVDVIKSLTLLPGVTSGGEGASGFNVRGGAVDQNLILLDEATIYNSSHLFGLFSVFNSDAIKDLRIYKGGIPARYGGRVSSVLDIFQKEGNNRSFHINGGIGLISSRLLAEGPLKKETGSFLVGGRATYAHLFLPLIDNENVAYFYDLNTKLSYKLNNKNSIFLSGYFGRDAFNIADSFKNTYGNAVLNFRWNHLFSDQLFSNLSFIYSDYYYGLDLDFVGFKWNSGIKNINVKYDLKHYLTDSFKLFYGINSIYYHFNPGEIKPSSSSSGINEEKLINKYAFENALYLEAEHDLTKNLALSYGLRFSSFYRLGQNQLNIYENNEPVVFNNGLKIYEKAPPISVNTYKRNDVIESFHNLEPRFSLAYQFKENTSFKASYNRMSQYLHLISNTSSPTPLDIWTPSGKYIKPQLLDQYAVGYFKTFNNDNFSLEIESFYKSIKNRIDYIDGADLIANDAIEQVILNGKARAYGFELLFKKNKGILNGWISYTLSKSQQQTPGRTSIESGINNGKWYYTPYDKTHDISAVATIRLNDNWTFNSNFLLQSGQPITYPNGQYSYSGITVAQFEPRNSNRLPQYHRLDISFNHKPKKSIKKKWSGEWVFGIYNVYNRKNAASISFSRNNDLDRNEAVRLSIFGIVPSVTYNFKF